MWTTGRLRKGSWRMFQIKPKWLWIFVRKLNYSKKFIKTSRTSLNYTRNKSFKKCKTWSKNKKLKSNSWKSNSMRLIFNREKVRYRWCSLSKKWTIRWLKLRKISKIYQKVRVLHNKVRLKAKISRRILKMKKILMINYYLMRSLKYQICWRSFKRNHQEIWLGI